MTTIILLILDPRSPLESLNQIPWKVEVSKN